MKIKETDGRSAPGITVGTPLILPLAGAHELYFVYSPADEQANPDLVMQVLGAGGVALLLLVGAMTWVVVYSVLTPVRRTVRTVERLAVGDLNARVLSQGQDEMAQLADSLNRMAGSLQSKIDTLGQTSRPQQRFVSDVSHGLRTPLTTMRIADDVIFDARRALDPAALRSMELLHDQIERFDAMLADLLKISRIDSGPARLSFETADINALTRQVVEDTASLAEKVGCKVVLNLPAYPCTTELDTHRVTRIIRNLVVNAIEHSEGNPVVITTDTSGTVVSPRISDHGVGMSPEMTSRVFDRFYRADTAWARTTGGTGLGLAVSLEGARLSGGTLEAWGREGYGSSFRLILPRLHGGKMRPAPVALTDYMEPKPEEYQSTVRGEDV